MNNRKVLKISLITIFLSLLLIVIHYKIFEINEPIVIQIYEQKPIFLQEKNTELIIDDNIEIAYIMNKYDNRTIEDIDFEHYPEIETSINRLKEYDTEYFGNYKLKKLNLEIKLSDLKSDYQPSEIILNESIITLSDGEKNKIELGGIEFYEEGFDSSFLINTLMVSVSNIDGVRQEGKVLRDFEIMDIEENEDLYQIRVNSLGIPDNNEKLYYKNKYIYIMCNFKYKENIINKYTVYNINPKITLKDNEGRIYEHRINLNNFNINFEGIDIYKYLKERGAL